MDESLIHHVVDSECVHGGCLNCCEVPSFDVEFGDDISEDVFTDCVICVCAQNASNSLLLQCCGNRQKGPHWLPHPQSPVLWFEMPFLFDHFGRVSYKSSIVHNVQLPPEPHSDPFVATVCFMSRIRTSGRQAGPIAPSSSGGSWVSQWVCRMVC